MRLSITGTIALALIGGTAESHAVIASPDPLCITNPDGTTLTVVQHGDEWFNYTTTADGYLITKAADGYFHYAGVVDGQEVALEIKATDADQRTADVSAMLRAMTDTPTMVKQLYHATATTPQRSYSDGTAEKQETVPTIGSPRFPVILVQFPDKKFDYSVEQFEDWLMKEGYNYNNGTGASSGSVNDYFKASSNGQFSPQFDIYGPVTASNEHDYYAYSSGSYSKRTASLVREACNYLHDNGDIDFTKYDNDNNGTVDVVYIVFAGAGAADSGDTSNIWPHKWVVSGDGAGTLKISGKTISTYGCSPELSYGKYFTAIGTFCHEFGHAIGLKDHYDTAYNGNRHPGTWDIMASANYNNKGNTPPLYSAYERSVMGWLTPTVLSEADNYVLRANSTTEGYSDAYVIPTSSKNEYFVLENRQQNGWDSSLPHHGMLVWHIDYNSSIWSSNKINTTEHQYIDIEEAGGVSNTDDTATPFPGKTDNRSFTDDTTPSMLTWNEVALNSPVTFITEDADGTISFKFKGGKTVESQLKLNEPQVAYDQATLSWEALEGVTEYYVTITNASTGTTIVDNLEVSDTSYTATSLQSETTYNYTLAYYDGYQWPTISSTFTTTKVPLSLRRPENVRTTEVGETYFTAEWDATDDTEGYTIDLYTGTVGGSTTVKEGFDNSTLLEGWSSNPSTPTYITTTGYYGTDAPAVLLETNNYITSTIYSANITKVTLKTRRYGSDNGTITIYGRSSSTGEWEELATKTAGNTRATTTVTLEASQNIHQIKVVQTAEEAKATVDDITLTLDASYDLQPVEGKTGLDAGNNTSYEVTGLDYNTQYYYTVTAYNTTDTSMASAPVEVTTDDIQPLSKRRPTNVRTIEVGDTYFIAEWDETLQAETYSVDVYTATRLDETTVTEGFDDDSLSEGWTTTSTEPTYISTSGYYGTDAPAMSLPEGESVVSPIYDSKITKVSLKTRRYGSTNGTITIYGRTYSTGEWTLLVSKTAGNTRSTISTDVDTESDIHQIKVEQTASSATATVDDITLTLDWAYKLQPVEGKTGLDAGAETKLRVSGLEYATTYYYTVTAHNATDDSAASETVEVTTDEYTAIDNVEADNNATVSVVGTVVTIVTATDATVAVYTPGGASVASPTKVEAQQATTIQLPTVGIYIVKVGGNVYKIVAE